MDILFTVFLVLLSVYLIVSYWMAYSFFADRDEFIHYMEMDGCSDDDIADYKGMCDEWDTCGFFKKNWIASTFLVVAFLQGLRA